MSPNSEAVTRRPWALTEYWNAVPAGEGGWPIDPAGFCRFCAAMASLMSLAVTPNCAMRSGFTQTRME